MNIREYSERVNMVTEKWSFNQLNEWKVSGKLIFGSEMANSREWPQLRRIKLIESIMMDIPLAPIFAIADYQGRLVIFDGLNRLSSVFAFIDNDFPLKNLQILRSYNGKNFASLPPYLQSRINGFTIQLCIIKPGTDEKVAASILQRVNSQSTAINKQKVIDYLNKISKT